MKRFFLLVLSGALLLSVNPAIAKTVELTFSSGFPVQQVITRTIIIPWIEEINKASGGEVKIKLRGYALDSSTYNMLWFCELN
jgi:hypothetical protein